MAAVSPPFVGAGGCVTEGAQNGALGAVPWTTTERIGSARGMARAILTAVLLLAGRAAAEEGLKQAVFPKQQRRATKLEGSSDASLREALRHSVVQANDG